MLAVNGRAVVSPKPCPCPSPIPLPHPTHVRRHGHHVCPLSAREAGLRDGLVGGVEGLGGEAQAGAGCARAGTRHRDEGLGKWHVGRCMRRTQASLPGRQHCGCRMLGGVALPGGMPGGAMVRRLGRCAREAMTSHL